MNKNVHLLYAFILSFPFIKIDINSIIFLLFSFAGALIPDIDLEFGHRIFLHNFIIVAIFILLMIYNRMPDMIIISTSIGWISHILLDIFTSKGVKIFLLGPWVRFPINERIIKLIGLILFGLIITALMYPFLKKFIF
ncbi:MAG: metal-dependent hydrolase [Nitrososphaerota archaeon]